MENATASMVLCIAFWHCQPIDIQPYIICGQVSEGCEGVQDQMKSGTKVASRFR